MGLNRNDIAGVVLCGGNSTRMGRPKWSLPFGDETFLDRTLRVIEPVAGRRLVVAAAHQQLPRLPADIVIVRDQFPEKGPLAGISAALDALEQSREPPVAAYVTACDVPLLRPEFVAATIDALGNYDLAVPRQDRLFHPLAAVYRVSLAETARKLVQEDRLRPLFLIEAAHSRMIDVDELRDIDPQLESLRNTNTPTDYAGLLTAAGLPVPKWARANPT